METIGDRLKQARKAKRFKQKEVCEALGIPVRQTLSGWENNRNMPGVDMVGKLARYYGVSMDWVTYGEEAQA